MQAGLTPYQAVRAGTSDAAIFLHQEAEFGTISSGLRADLLLLKANPLDNVDNYGQAGRRDGRWTLVYRG